MIANFSSLIELFAAIYLTISLDDLLLRRFWTPDYEKKVTEEFEKIKMPDLAKRPTIQNAAQLSVDVEKRSRKRGGLMFGLTVSLLIIIGFEEYFVSLDLFCRASLLLLLISGISLVYIFDYFFLKSWWSLLWVTLLMPLFIGVIAFVLPHFSICAKMNESDSGGSLVIVVKIVLVLALILPVVWQLFRNWMYTRYYLQYIIDQTSVKAKEYYMALRCDPSKGHKMSEIAQPYLNAVGKAVAAGNGDRPIKPFLDILQKELSKIEYVPTLYPLLKYSSQSYKKKHLSRRRLKKLYTKYKCYPKLPSMEKFCEDEKINYEAFKAYHLEQINRQ